MYSREQLAADFRTLGVAPGDTVMVHASVRAVGEVAGGPDQIHLALKDALTDEGTLVMYASCPAYYDEVGRGNLTSDQEREVLEKLPAFDAATARSARDNGTLVEFFRTWPGTLVNDHPVRFALWGKHAERLRLPQPSNYAFGAGSLLERFAALDGRILLLGSDHDTVTFLHYAEHIVNIPGKRVIRYRIPLAEGGARVWRDQEEFDSSERGAHPNWPERFFAKITDGYLEAAAGEDARVGRVGDAQAYLFSARGLLAFALPVMTAVAADARAADPLRELSGQPTR
jgi:aminoglycoside 3-N-acetyltransferase